MKKLINLLKKKKIIPLDEFINIALYDKNYGYYNNKYPFGENGDFVTAPNISKLFGEMIAIWCVSYWENLKKPKKILLVELGPGDGSLCNILLQSFIKFQEFYSSLEINLLERSKKLKKIQQKNIANKKVKWIDSIDKINCGPIIFFGNEFFDSLAIKQFYRKKKIYYEKYVSISKNNKNLKFIFKKLKKNLIKKIIKLNLSSKKTIEYPIDTLKYLKKIIKKINKFNGCILALDYGYAQKNNKETLQSIKKHKYTDPLLNVGTSDISSHVNFELISSVLKKNNLEVKKIVTQSEFLQKIGIIERANILSKKMSFKQKANMFFRIKKLLNPKDMGNIFKVLFAQKKGNDFSLGFK